MSDKSITVSNDTTVALSELTSADLANPAKADAIVKLSVDLNDEAKEAKSRYDEVKDEFLRLAKGLSSTERVTLFGQTTDYKMTLTPVQRGGEIDEDKLMRAIYDACGEKVGDKTGAAWRTWLSITVEAPRVVDENKLLAVLRKAHNVEAGLEKGVVRINDAIVASATKAPEVSYRVTTSKMTKDELKSRDMGELTDCVEVG